MSKEFKKTLLALGLLCVLGIAWLFTFSPISWGFRLPHNGRECREISHEEVIDRNNNLYCVYKGRQYFYNYLGIKAL